MSNHKENSDGEEPESVSFTTSREAALLVLKAAAEKSKRNFQREKRVREDQRKRREEKRSKENLAKLDKLRGRAKDALSANQDSHNQDKTPKLKSMKNTKRTFDQVLDDETCLDNDRSGFIPFNKKSNKLSKCSVRDIDISEGNKIKVQVATTSKVHAADSVLKFRETMLYGSGSKIKRESSTKVLARKEKRKQCSQNVFCK